MTSLSSSPTIQRRETGALQAAAHQTISLADTLGRDDLALRLEATIERLARPAARLMIVGEFKQGKSSLANSLLGQALCPVDDDVATAVLTFVSHGAEATAVAHRRGAQGTMMIEPLDLDLSPDVVSEASTLDRTTERPLRVEFTVDSPILKEGLVLVDTPGVGGLESSHGAITIGALAEADAIIFLTDASQELTAPELAFLRRAHALCPRVIHAVSKIDLYPEWRRILDLTRSHLANAGLAGDVIAISSTLYDYAVVHDHDDLAAESGMPALFDLIRACVIGPNHERLVRSSLREVLSSAAQLAAPVEAEHAVLTDPTQSEALVNQYERARIEAANLAASSSGWQLTLSDGIADLNSDVDHDLRARTRRIIQETEASIDDADPADIWDEFEAALYAQVTNEIVSNFTLLTQRVQELSTAVEQHFLAAEQALAEIAGVAAPIRAIEGLTIASTIDLDRPGVVGQALTGLRGSYGGVLMFSMIGNMVGLAAMNPAVLVVGLLMGRKSLREEKKRQLNTRRQQAKAAVRKYVDEVSFQVGKDSRDSLRLTQRNLRDHFNSRAAELTRSMQEALAAAKTAAASDERSRTSRIAELETFLARLTTIEQQCAAVSASLGDGAGSGSRE